VSAPSQDLPADVLVAGAGPAGLAVAAELAVRGLSVVVVDPHPDRAWTATHCGWEDELARSPGYDPLRSVRVRHRAVVVDAGGRRRELDRDYVQLDAVGARTALHRRASSGSGAVHQLTGRVGDVRRHADLVAAVVTGGPDTRTVRARVVVDATGAGGVLTSERTPASDATVWQWAVGTIARFTEPPVATGGAVLMDWRQFRGEVDDPRVPGSFGYVLDRGDGTHLVEETVLAGPRVKGVMRVLRSRLAARLAAAGWTPDQVCGEELVAIPLDVGPRWSRGGVVPVGVAAGLVHPATGYSVTAALRTAPTVADAVTAALAAGLPPDAVAAAGSAALWPRTAVLGQSVLARGMRTTLGQDPAATAAFFATFFGLPTRTWAGYLAQPVDTAGVLAAMSRLWLALPASGSARLMGRWFTAGRHHRSPMRGTDGPKPGTDGPEPGTDGPVPGTGGPEPDGVSDS